MRVLSSSDAVVGMPKMEAPLPMQKGEESSPLQAGTRPSDAARGGIAHAAAQVTAAMSSMKTVDESLELFDKLYRHMLKTVHG